MMQQILFNFFLALEAVFANKLRAILTALGIVFGVAAVIAMLAIGRGAQEAIMEQMKLIGTNNIIITSKTNNNNDNSSQLVNQKKKRPYSPGLNLADLEAMQELLPTLSNVSPEIIQNTTIIQSGKLERAKCIGVTNAFFELNNIQLGEGRFFHKKHFETGKTVCIIGKNIHTKFFSEESPVGKKIKCGNTWMTIIGVLEKRIATKESLENLGIRDYNADIYIPITTSLLRFKNRAYISKKDLDRGNDDDDENSNPTTENYHQLDRLVLQIDQAENLSASAGIISRILNRRHLGVVDFEIEIPEKQIEAQQKTQDTFNLVLAVIAGISLLVGGIGIMNIMLASVLERIKEIGVRRSLGAKRLDITLQFLFEAIFISLIGGILGVILGVGAAEAIASAADIPTVVSTWSIVLSFGVAASIGLFFGLVPAQQAAQLDPIKALRTD